MIIIFIIILLLLVVFVIFYQTTENFGMFPMTTKVSREVSYKGKTFAVSGNNQSSFYNSNCDCDYCTCQLYKNEYCTPPLSYNQYNY